MGLAQMDNKRSSANGQCRRVHVPGVCVCIYGMGEGGTEYMSAKRPRATMKEALLSLLLLATLCSAVPVQGEVSMVKLCGREFFRAIIYTCGASRWRRILLQESQGQSSALSSERLFVVGADMVNAFIFNCSSMGAAPLSTVSYTLMLVVNLMLMGS